MAFIPSLGVPSLKSLQDNFKSSLKIKKMYIKLGMLHQGLREKLVYHSKTSGSAGQQIFITDFPGLSAGPSPGPSAPPLLPPQPPPTMSCALLLASSCLRSLLAPGLYEVRLASCFPLSRSAASRMGGAVLTAGQQANLGAASQLISSDQSAST